MEGVAVGVGVVIAAGRAIYVAAQSEVPFAIALVYGWNWVPVLTKL